MIFLGCDPGASGAIACVDGKGIPLGFVRLDLPPAEVWAWLREYDDARGAVLEKVGATPQMGVSSAFTFGQGYGGVRAFLVASSVPFEEVTPARWQAAMGVAKRASSRLGAAAQKGRTRARAQELFGASAISGVRYTNVNSDAYLLAEYARRLHAARGAQPL